MTKRKDGVRFEDEPHGMTAEDFEARKLAHERVLSAKLGPFTMPPEMQAFIKKASEIKEIPGVPYPFCRHPDKCRGTGRCQHDPVCND